MFYEALSFLCDALIQPFAAVLLFRFHAVWLQVPMRNPIGEFVMALSDFAVLRLRHHIPAVGKLDMATLLLAFAVEFVYLVLYLAVHGYPFDFFPLAGLLAWTVIKLLKISVYLLISTLLAEAILSWVNPRTPVAALLGSVNTFFVRPVRRIIPPIGHIDLSILVLLILCQLILIAPLGALEQLATGML